MFRVSGQGSRVYYKIDDEYILAFLRGSGPFREGG